MQTSSYFGYQLQCIPEDVCCFVFKTIAINHLSVRCLYFFIVSYRKEIETQVTTGYKQGIQKNDSEHATHQTQKQMSYSNRRPYQGPII